MPLIRSGNRDVGLYSLYYHMPRKTQVYIHQVYLEYAYFAIVVILHLACKGLALYFYGRYQLIVAEWRIQAHITTIGSDNGLAPGWRLAIIWTNTGILLNEPIGTNCSEIKIKTHTYSFKKLQLEMPSRNLWQFRLCLNVLTHIGLATPYGTAGLYEH